MQFELQVSPDGSDYRSLIRTHDRRQVMPCLPPKMAIKVRDALNAADEDLEEYVELPNPMALFCADPKRVERFKAMTEKRDTYMDQLMFTLWKVLPEVFQMPTVAAA